MISTFSGVGMQERGFINSNLFDIEVVATSEIDKEAILSYAAIHHRLTNELVDNYEEYPSKEEMVNELKSKNIGYDFKKNELFDWDKLASRKVKNLKKYWLAMKLSNNLGDVCKIESLPQCDLLTFSFPCQSISIAGKQEGIIKGETRSGLIYEIIRLIEIAKKNRTLPKYLMLENVSALVSKKFIKDFNNLNNFFDDIGYNVYWSLINGKDCGIPQSRNRCFAMYIRKDIDNGKYEFPVPFDIGIRLKDVLEDQVDKKYYLPDEKVQEFLKTIDLSQFCKKDNELHQLGYINDYNGDANRIYSDNVARTLKYEAGGGGAKTGWYAYGIDKSINDPQILESENCITSREDRGISNRKAEGTAILETPDISYCLDANYWKGTTPEQYVSKKRRQLIFEQISQWIRIRKLTPRECYRLMGLTFEDCDKAAEIGVADTHLYKQAGNGIITNCCALLAEHLYKAQYDNTYICTDERYQGNFTKPQVE